MVHFCKTCGAHKRSVFAATEDDDAVRCVLCRLPDDVNVIVRYCEGKEHPSGKAFRITVTSATGYLCYVCRHFGEYRNRKEREVVAYLSEHNADREPSLLDKQINGNLSLRYRPDIYYDLGDRALIVEVDEHQHDSYPADCEAKRMLEFAMTLNMPTVFLRYNPDRYEDDDGVVRRVRKTRRLSDLSQRVSSWIAKSRTEWPKFFAAEYLWYSKSREDPCRDAVQGCLEQVFALHPELKTVQ